ncbi:MAG: hypothetical protein RL217_598, partial [Pseudomonadota bacterium]
MKQAPTLDELKQVMAQADLLKTEAEVNAAYDKLAH